MTTISVPLSKELLERLEQLVKSGAGENKAAVMRRALEDFDRQAAINEVLEAEKEPYLRGDLDELAKKIR